MANSYGFLFNCTTVGQNPDLKKVSKGAKIRNRYNQVPHLTQDSGYHSSQYVNLISLFPCDETLHL